MATEYKILIDDNINCNNDCYGLVEGKTGGLCIVFDGAKLKRYKSEYILHTEYQRCDKCKETFEA